ncbi:Ger(x)C family spore germination protein [Bacillus benzoevorans]|uniref:Spore germination protein KC n=1 Tax=Bacillus benzoevorans TaxID=1456 RepID=A0A7X0LX26_9BACI|nr:Ger(x)C family spore germination protein [Bacillus benzoevorans]MBB6447328.1 spore germination protein KC [Bacillus benzoevorans]
MRRNLLMCMALGIFLTGCWDQRELSTVAIVTGMAVDKGESGRFQLSVLGINAAELNEQTAQGNSPTAMYTLEGSTLAELSQKMNVAFSKNLVYSHMKVFVISKEIAQEGLLHFLDYLERNREIRDDVNIVVAKEGKAKDILKVTSILQKDSALKLDMQLQQARKVWGLHPDVRLNDLIDAITSPGRQPVLAVVKAKGDVKKGESVDNMKKPEPDAVIVIDSMAVFKDKKMLGFLSEEDARMYLWTQNEIENTTLSVPCEGKKFSTVKITDSKTKLKGKLVNGTPEIHIDLSMLGYLMGSDCGYPLDKPDSYTKIEKLTEKYVEEHIAETIKKVQQDYGVDIFGFGEVIQRQDYQQFKKVKDHWDEAFRNAKVTITTDVLITDAGIRTRGVFDRIK